MSTRSALKGALLIVACLSFARPVLAVDPYEAVQDFAASGDDDNPSNVTLTTGLPQTHDLDQAGGGEDQDWMVVPTIARHSYEARVSASSIGWDAGACPSLRPDRARRLVRRRSHGGRGDRERRQPARPPNPTTSRCAGSPAARRSTSSCGCPGARSSPRTPRRSTPCASGTRPTPSRAGTTSPARSTVFVISSLIQAPASVRIDFYSALGTLLGSQSFTLNANQLIVFNTGTLPALAGQSGHAYVVHTAGYGGLAGKAVALEAATGFSFDTPMVPIPN